MVRVLQDVTSTHAFDTYADLADALKTRCAKLKIRYDGSLVSEAVSQLERGGARSLICRSHQTAIATSARVIATPGISDQSAREILRRLTAGVRTMPTASDR